MAYHIDAEKVSLDDLQKRLEATDLVPSRASLKEGAAGKMRALEEQGVTTLAGLRNEIKNAKHLAAIAKATGIEEQYLVLLRREIEGYFPRPVDLKTFTWLPGDDIARLEQKGISDTATLYEMADNAQKRTALAKSVDVPVATLEALIRLADLMRVQWVMAACYDSAARVAAADPAELCEALMRVNSGDKFFKGKIGLRDVKRLILAASYV